MSICSAFVKPLSSLSVALGGICLFSQISISEYKQWISVSLATLLEVWFEEIVYFWPGWDSRLQQFNLCLMFLFPHQLHLT